MKNIRVYLDNCSFNRPYDDQSQIRIKLETDAKLYIQDQIRMGSLELAWSYMMDYEISFHPYQARREAIETWRTMAVVLVYENLEIISMGSSLKQHGLGVKDALHLACAMHAGCAYLITTDDQFIKKSHGLIDVTVINPLDVITLLPGDKQ